MHGDGTASWIVASFQLEYEQILHVCHLVAFVRQIEVADGP